MHFTNVFQRDGVWLMQLSKRLDGQVIKIHFNSKQRSSDASMLDRHTYK